MLTTVCCIHYNGIYSIVTDQIPHVFDEGTQIYHTNKVTPTLVSISGQNQYRPTTSSNPSTPTQHLEKHFLLYFHCAKKPVTTMLTYPWKCTVLHCNHLGNTWKPLVLMT